MRMIYGKLSQIIPEEFHEKLLKLNIANIDNFLISCANAFGRKYVAKEMNVDLDIIENWTKKADIMCVPGIGEKYCILLQKSGIKTLEDLKQANIIDLYNKIIKTNNELKRTFINSRPYYFSKITPSPMRIKKWIDFAKNKKSFMEF